MTIAEEPFSTVPSQDEEKVQTREQILDELNSFRERISAVIEKRLSRENPTELAERIIYLRNEFDIFSGAIYSLTKKCFEDYEYQEVKSVLHNWANYFSGPYFMAQAFLITQKELSEEAWRKLAKEMEENLQLGLSIAIGNIRTLEVLTTHSMVEVATEYTLRLMGYLEDLPVRERSFSEVKIYWHVEGKVADFESLREKKTFVDLLWLINFLGNIEQNATRIFSKRAEPGEGVNLRLNYQVTDTDFILSVEDDLGGFAQGTVEIVPSLVDQILIERVNVARGASTTGGQGIGLDSLRADVEKNGGEWEMGSVTTDGQRRARISFKVPLT